MAKKTVCDVCESEILDGANVGSRKPVFIKQFNGSSVEVTTAVKIAGKTDPDLCLACLRKVVAEA